MTATEVALRLEEKMKRLEEAHAIMNAQQRVLNETMRKLMDNLALVSTPMYVIPDDEGRALANALRVARGL